MDESEAIPSSTLFPAYAFSSTANNQGEKQEWLHNNSFTDDAYQTYIKQQKLNDTAQDAQEIEANEKQTEEKHVKKKKKKRKQLTKEKEKKIKIEAQPSVTESSFFDSYFSKITFLEESGISAERAFRCDSRPEYQTLSFGTFDQKAIAKYSDRFKIPIGSSKIEITQLQKVLSRKAEKGHIRYFSKRSKNFFCEETPVLQQNKDIMKLLTEYIPLDPQSVKSSSEKKFVAGFDGISTDWKLPQDSVTKNSINDTCSFEEQEHYRKTAQFNSSLVESPHNEQLWLNFVDFQHKFFQAQSFHKNDISVKTVIEKQMTVLDKALSHNPNSVKLSVARLKLRRNFHEAEELIKEWEKLIFYHPNDVKAWQEYLFFIMSDISYFTISRVVKIYRKCITSLCNIEQGIMKSHSAPPDLLLHIIDIFGDLCTTFRNSGHTERAFGTFQAALEFNLFPPSSVTNLTSCADRATFFEPFWDCGASRIGEENAFGWAVTVTERKIASSTNTPKTNLSDLEDGILSSKLPVWQIWLEFEKLRASNHWLPWRPHPTSEETSDDVDDPDRMVTFEQISTFLFKVDNERSKFFLFCKFLGFLGVTLHLSECPHFPEKSEKSLSLLEDFDYLSDIIKDIFPNKKIPDCLTLRNIKLLDYLNFINCVFQHVDKVFSEKYKKLASLFYLRHIINMTFMPFPNQINESMNMKNLRKTAKSLLKRAANRNCLFLWSEYIRVEYETSNIESADQMFERLYASSCNVSSLNDENYKMLWYFVWRYIELSMGIRKCHDHNPRPFPQIRDKILVILSHLGTNEKYILSTWEKGASPTMLIKALANFKSLLEHEFPTLDLEAKHQCKCLDPQNVPLLDCLLCGIYLHYFAQGLNASLKFLDEAMQLLEEKMETGSSEVLRYIEEQVFVYKIELFNFHHQTVPSSLKAFHLNLCDAVEKFPRNVRLLHILVKTKTASAIVGPTRRFFFKLLGDDPMKLSPITWFFAIVYELTICSYIQEPVIDFGGKEMLKGSSENLLTQGLGMIWKIRSLFERCLKATSSEHTIALWRFYMKYEMLLKDESRALAIFHRALQNCPWSKALLLDGIEYFNEDCQKLVDLMAAKQLRVRTPFEEIQLLTEHLSKEP